MLDSVPFLIFVYLFCSAFSTTSTVNIPMLNMERFVERAGYTCTRECLNKQHHKQGPPALPTH